MKHLYSVGFTVVGTPPHGVKSVYYTRAYNRHRHSTIGSVLRSRPVQTLTFQNQTGFHRFPISLYLKQNMAPRSKDLEAEVLNWIFTCLGESVPKGEFEDILKDGVVLCNLMNKLMPGCIKKIQSKGTNFQLMENIQRFQAAAKKYGLPEEEIFQTADLFERRNIAQVCLSLFALGRTTQHHPEWTGPTLGPKMADENKRTFTEEQLRAHEGELNLQMGYNKGASQAGVGSFGNTRHM